MGSPRANIWLWGTTAILVVAIWVGGCVSRTLPDQRISDSANMPAPTNTVSVADPDNFTFAFVGDLHLHLKDTTRWSAILAAAEAEGDAFVAVLGDIADLGDADDYVAYNAAIIAAGWQGKVFSAIGNHDIFNVGWPNYRDNVGPSFYTENVGNYHFIVVDTADGTLGWEQGEWLKGELHQNTNRSVVFSHYLPVVPGWETYLKMPNIAEGLTLMRSLQANGALAWLGGHFHGYAAGPVGGVQYVTAGGGGGRRMGPFSDYFFMQASISPGKISFNIRKLPN